MDCLAKFGPIFIAIEVNPRDQSTNDSLYKSTVEGKHQLSRNETQQIGFRLGKKLGIRIILCVDVLILLMFYRYIVIL